MTSEVQQANVDRMAQELYQTHGHCRQCKQTVPLADALQCHCPHCGAIYLPGAITPERGRAMLATLKARRRELGLSEWGKEGRMSK